MFSIITVLYYFDITATTKSSVRDFYCMTLPADCHTIQNLLNEKAFFALKMLKVTQVIMQRERLRLGGPKIHLPPLLLGTPSNILGKFKNLISSLLYRVVPKV